MHTKARASVLIVEDSLAVAKRLEASLERAGFLVEIARNGREALRQSQRHPFDLVITDEQMPIMSGREFCKQLRADNRYANTPIIFLTAENIESELANVEDDLRVSAVFHKPFNPTTLLHAVESELSADRRTQRKTDDEVAEPDHLASPAEQSIAPREFDAPAPAPAVESEVESETEDAHQTSSSLPDFPEVIDQEEVSDLWFTFVISPAAIPEVSVRAATDSTTGRVRCVLIEVRPLDESAPVTDPALNLTLFAAQG